MSEKKYPSCTGCRLIDSKLFNPKETGPCDILVIEEHPTKTDCKCGHYANNENRLVLNAARKLETNYKMGFDFAIGCVPPDICRAADISRCAFRIQRRIQEANPKVIVAMGTNAAKALGFKKPIKHLRGRIAEVKIGEQLYKVVFTYSPGTIYKKPGLCHVLEKDLGKALDVCSGEQEAAELIIQIPQSYDEVIQLLDKAQEAVDSCNQRLLVSVDTETSSLEAHKRHEKMIAVSLSWAKNQGMAFLLDHKGAGYSEQKKKGIAERLEQLLQSPKIYTCLANAKFDYKWVYHHYGLNIPFPNADVILLEHALAEDKEGEYGLKQLTRDYLPEHGGYDAELDNALRDADTELRKEHKRLMEQALEVFMKEWQALEDNQRKERLGGWVAHGFIPITDIAKFSKLKTVNKRGVPVLSKTYTKGLQAILKKIPAEASGVNCPEPMKATFEDIPVEILLRYAAMDAMVTRMIFVKQHRIMARTTLTIPETATRVPLYDVFLKHTMPLCEKIAEMEYNGVRLDRDKTRQHMETIDRRLAELEESPYAIAGRRFNMSSSAKDLGEILFREMGFSPVNYTETGKPGTDKASLKTLYENSKVPFLKDLLAHRKIEKVRNTYFRNWLEASAYDGHVHFSLKQHGTTTHRLSSDKGLQNAPARLAGIDMGVKELFIPDTEDMEFYDLDIANAEMRVLCAYSRDQALIEAFNNGKDFHSLTAAGISEYSYEQILADKEDKSSEAYQLRQLGKKINFGTVYSMGPGLLKEQLWNENGIGISEKEARQYLDKFFAAYPGVATYIEQTKAFAAKHKYVYTYTGRIRRFPLIGNDRSQEGRAYRQAVNARIQTTSADIVNTNLIDISDAIKPLGGRVVLTVHDSILFQLPKGTSGVKGLLDRVIIDNTREKFPWLPVTWKYDVGRGPNYGECKYDVT